MADTQKHQPNWCHADYLNKLIPTDKLAKTARLAKIALKQFDYDAIACRGVSGLLIAPMMAVRLKKSLLVVRKPGENNHSGRMVEGDAAAKRYIILDDFTDSGETAKAIKRAIDKFAPEAVCLGVLEVNKLHSSIYFRPGPAKNTKLRTEWIDQMAREDAKEAREQAAIEAREQAAIEAREQAAIKARIRRKVNECNTQMWQVRHRYHGDRSQHSAHSNQMPDC
jgi:hypoxanthine phosphoribosyltransferase